MSKNVKFGLLLVVLGMLANNYIYLIDHFSADGGATPLDWRALAAISVGAAAVAVGVGVALKKQRPVVG